MSSANLPNWQKARDRMLGTIPDMANRVKLLEYLNEREANGAKNGTLGNEANALRDLCLHLGPKPLEAVTRADVTAFVNSKTRERIWRNVDRDGQEKVTRREIPLSQSTLSCRKVIVKCFFKWLRGSEDYPPEVRHLKTARPRPDAIPADALVTKEDLKALLQAHPGRRDKALLAVLYESGFRAGELCALNVGSVEFSTHGARVTLPKGAPGLKTGARSLLLWDSIPFLRDWWENHPHREQPLRPLFFSNSHRAPMVRMTNGALHSFIRDAAERAGIKKRIHPHLFRHTAATERVRLGWTEGMMRDFFGWRKSSDMPSHYVHLAGHDYEKLEMERRGLIHDAEVSKPALSSLLCPTCKHANLLTAAFCQQCSRPVSPWAEGEVMARRQDELKEMVAKMVAEALRNGLGGTPAVQAAPGITN